MRSGGSTANWQAVFAAYDRLRELPESERAAELDRIAREQPELEPLLQAMRGTQAEELQRQGFLDIPAVPANPPDVPQEAGVVLGSYRLERAIGAGGMGQVWLARRADGLFDAPVALKLLHPHLATLAMRERFVREGRILGQMSHPNIARLLDAGTLPDGRLYLALEYVEGDRIDTWCDQQSLDTRARLALFRQVCDAVSHAHARLVVHRDLKPSNVMVTPQGAIKLLDFGIAKLLEGTEGSSQPTELTRVGGRVMTPEYAAPEQILGQAVTVATDVYSLGVVLYVLLTGRRPYGRSDTSFAQLEREVVETEPFAPSTARGGEVGDDVVAGQRGTSPRALRAELRGDLDTIVLKALKKRPAERYASVDALGEDLRRFLAHEPVLARPDSVAYRVRKYVRRHRVAVIGAAAVIVSLCIGLVAALMQGHEIRLQAQDLARRQEELSAVVAFQGRMLERMDVDRFSRALSADLDAHLDMPTAARKSLATFLLGPAAEELKTAGALSPDAESAMQRALATGYRTLAQYPESLEHIERAIALRTATHGEWDPQTVEAQFDRVTTLRRLGRAADGGRTIDALLPGLIAHFGAEHDLTLRARALGESACVDVGDFARCETQARELLAVAERVQGPEGRDALAARHVLSSSIFGQGRYAESIPLLERAWKDETRIYGADDRFTLGTGQNLVQALAGAGRLEESIALGRQLLEISSKRFGRDHDISLDAITNLANALFDHGDLAESGALAREVWQTSAARFGAEHPDTLIAQHNYAISVASAGDFAKARQILEEVVAVRSRTPGPDAQVTLESRKELGSVMAMGGDLKGAAAMLQDTADVEDRVLGHLNPETLITRRELAGVLWHSGERQRAATLLAETAQGFFDTLGADHFKTRLVVANLAFMLRALGQSAEADRWLERVPGAKDQKPSL